MPPPTELTGNATPITIKAALEGRKAVKKVRLPVSAGFDVFMEHLAKKFKGVVDVATYVDEEEDEVEIDVEDAWREAAQYALELGGSLKVQVTLEA